MIITIIIFIASLLALVKGSDWFIAASEKIGLALGIPSFIIGVTIVAFGTSLPELASSIVSVYEGKSDIVIGNVIGSNITNILLVIGCVTIVVKRLNLRANIMDIDMPMLLFSAFFLWFMLYDGEFNLAEAVLMLFALVVFLVHSLSGHGDEKPERSAIQGKDVGLLILGGLGVYFGAKYTIESLIELASALAVDTGVIAVSLVALGTSLPEVVVSLAAAKRGQTDMAIGNVIGSNIFNTYAVMAIPSFFGPLDIPESVTEMNLPLMVATTILFAFMCISKQITRWEATLLVLLYFFFIINLINNT